MSLHNVFANRWYAATLACFLISGCGDAAPSAHTQGIPSISERPGSRVAVDTLSALCHECVTLEEVIALGDTAGPGMYEGAGNVVVDDMGRFWVIAWNHVTVFDSSGTYVMTIGREGRGPGEFSRARLAYLAETGAVHVYDSRNARVTAVDPDGDVVFMENVSGLVRSAKSHPDSGAVLNIESFDPSDTPAVASHVVGEATIARYTTGESGSPMEDFWRSVAVDGKGVVYAAKHWDYVIEVWTQPGEPLGRIERPGLWERTPLGTSRALAPGTAPAASIADISVIDDRWLVVVSWAKADDWQDWVEERTSPDGFASVVPKAGTDKLWDSYVEVIDLESFTLLSTVQLPWLVNGIVNDSILFGDRMEGPVPQIVLSRVRIAQPDPTE